MKIKVETSARHIHLNEETFKYLCGEDAKLEVKKMLSQPGQFVSTTRLEVIGPKGSCKTSILGPIRNYNQVELAATDLRNIGLDAPIRESGNLEGTPGVKIKNIDNGKEVELKSGLIIAKRHIHMTPKDAEEFGLKSGDIVKVRTGGEGRKVIFEDVVVRVHENFALAMHIDTDESNASSAGSEIEGEIIK